MLRTYLKIGGAAIALVVATGIYFAGYEAGQDKEQAKQAEAVQKAVAEAQKKWQEQVEADREITDAVDEREVEIREIEKIVYRDVIKWKAPPACRDLGFDFRRLFNAGARPAGPDTPEAD